MRENHLRALLFALVFSVHCLSPVVQVGDSRLNTATALSIVRDGDLDLDEYAFSSDTTRYDLSQFRSHQYWAFPWPSALVSVPAIAALDLAGVDLVALAEGEDTWLIEKPIASGLVAGATVVLYCLAMSMLSGDERRRRKRALSTALVFAFATSAWSTASLALWTHAPSLLLLSIALLSAQRIAASDPNGLSVKPLWAVILGATAAGAYAVRPTNLIALAVLTIWLCSARRRYVVPYLAGASAVIAAFVTVDLASFGRVLPPYYDNGRLSLLEKTPEILIGQLISPSRGLLLFTPVAMVAIAGVVIALRARTISSLMVAASSIVIAHWLALGLFDHWWGGSSFGPRLFTDMLPFLVLLAMPAVDAIGTQAMSRLTAVAIATCVVVSVLFNAQGALVRASWCWNADPIDIDASPDRLWDWSDPQAVRGARAIVEQGPKHAIFGSCDSDT